MPDRYQPGALEYPAIPISTLYYPLNRKRAIPFAISQAISGWAILIYLPRTTLSSSYTMVNNIICPWESTVCISQRWFFNTTDTVYKSVDELTELYRIATRNDNILILNCPPNREGKIREKDIADINATKEKYCQPTRQIGKRK